MGKRSRPETPTFGPIIARTGWLHRSDGSAIEARELLGNHFQKYIGTHPDYGCHGGWTGVSIVEYSRIEWDEASDSPATLESEDAAV